MAQQPNMSPYPVSDFLQWKGSDQLELTPKFQRRDVWPAKAKSYLIDSIVRKMPIPPVFLRLQTLTDPPRTVREVVDGQQRLSCVLNYIAGGFPILAVHNAEYGNMYYAGWQPDTTLKRASKYFDAGEPYETAVKGAKSVLDDTARIRNRIAHRSDHSVIEFQDVVRTHLGFVPKGMTPGRFLLATLPSAGKPAIDHYTAIVSATANLIANHK